MKYKLAAETLNQSSQCKSNFSCLTGNKSCLCEVEQLINHRLLFIKPENTEPCDYKHSFGYSAYYCSCPARLEIYRLYNA